MLTFPLTMRAQAKYLGGGGEGGREGGREGIEGGGREGGREGGRGREEGGRSKEEGEGRRERDIFLNSQAILGVRREQLVVPREGI